MQFRCYSCGYVFSNTMPPFEALGKAQASAVGRGYEGDPTNRLCEALSNLSVYNFCAFCARLVEFQDVWVDHPGHQFVHGVWIPATHDHELNSCSCGHVYDPPTYLRYDSHRWQWINRAKRLHMFQMFYLDEWFTVDYWDLEMEG